jgi:hypothetical protein
LIETPDGTLETVPLADLPEGVCEGDLLKKNESGFSFEESATAQRKKEMFDLQGGLFDRD